MNTAPRVELVDPVQFEGLPACEALQKKLTGNQTKVLACRLAEEYVIDCEVKKDQEFDLTEVRGRSVAITDTVTKGFTVDVGYEGIFNLGFSQSVVSTNALTSNRESSSVAHFPTQGNDGTWYSHLLVLKAEILNLGGWLSMSAKLLGRIRDIETVKNQTLPLRDLKALILREHLLGRDDDISWWERLKWMLLGRCLLKISKIDYTVSFGHTFLPWYRAQLEAPSFSGKSVADFLSIILSM